jgi:putative FmdB family regulatory protein
LSAGGIYYLRTPLIQVRSGMPTYDYECTKCGHTFDVFQSMSESPLKKCPECGQNRLKRLIGGGLGVIFKGSGFYVTDSRSSGSSNGKKSTDTAASASNGGSKESAAKNGGSGSESASKKDTGSRGSGSEKVAG